MAASNFVRFITVFWVIMAMTWTGSLRQGKARANVPAFPFML